MRTWTHGSVEGSQCAVCFRTLSFCIVVTYFQFDSNIRVLYVFLGFLKNT
jgi:hypothetical protein